MNMLWICAAVVTDRRLFIMMEQFKMTMDSFGQQLQQQTSILQWLAGRLGGVEEVNNQLPENLRLPASSLDELHDLEQQISTAETRSKVVCLLNGYHIEMSIGPIFRYGTCPSPTAHGSNAIYSNVSSLTSSSLKRRYVSLFL